MDTSSVRPMPWGSRSGFGVRATRLEELEFAYENGFDFVDLDFNRRDEIQHNGAVLRARAAELGVAFTAHGAGRMFDAENGFEKTLVDLDTAAVYAPLSFTIHPIFHPRRFSIDELRAKADRIATLTARAAALGIVVGVENIIEEAENFAGILDTIPELGLTLDVGHAELLADRNKSFGFIERYSARIVHVHLHDNFGGATVKDDLHLEVGQGAIDFPQIIGELVKHGYQRTFLFEIEAHAAVRSRNRIATLCGIAQVGHGIPTSSS